MDAAEQLSSILPSADQIPQVEVNIRDWTRFLSDDIRAVSNKTNCLSNIESFYRNRAKFQALDPNKLRDNILSQIDALLSQHRAAVDEIVSEAENLAVKHNFVKNLRFNYTDVHRLRNELEPQTGNNNNNNQDATTDQSYQSQSSGSGYQSGQSPQFTSINGGTPVPGPAEWQTPFRSILMQMNRNFGDIPVNSSMSAVHLPLPIYPGQPEIMNGIAWSEGLDRIFSRNLREFMHVHHQYYGDHLGFMRTFPAHKWRIARTEPDLFDARTRPWYSTGASSPKDIVILVDTSGSMTGLRREIAKGVVFEILDTLTSNDFFTVMRFSETLTPVGFPRCNLKTPRMGPALEELCSAVLDQASECSRYRRQQEQQEMYPREHPSMVAANNGSYITDAAYRDSLANVTQDIRGAYLLRATSRNIRYLKSNFSMPTSGIANFTHALMGAFELLQAYNRTELGSQCNQAIMVITDGAIKSSLDVFNRYNYPNGPIRVFSYMIGREVGDISHTKAMACSNRGYYTHVINLSEVREQVLKYLPVMARPMVLSHQNAVSWTNAYGDETHQVLTDWVLEIKRRERARLLLIEERERINDTERVNIELTNLSEYDELPLVDEELKNRMICFDTVDGLNTTEQQLQLELDPLGYNELGCHWSSRRADLLISVVKPVFDRRNSTLYFERVLYKNIWTEKETQVRNAQLLGVAAVDLRVADVASLAPSYLLGPNGYLILVGQNGFIMHHPELRALLEDPFDKQSKILKPFFSSVDLTHIEQVYHKNESDLIRRRSEDNKLLKLRESMARRQSGFESLLVKRAVDCQRRLHLRQQVFYYAPIKETPYSLIIALPSSYGLNRLEAKLELTAESPSYLKPSEFELWSVHPDYKYCESSAADANSSQVSIILEALRLHSSNLIAYDDLGRVKKRNEHYGSSRGAQIVCDRELFPSLLFDAAATFEPDDSSCSEPNYDNCDSDQPGSELNCARGSQELR